MQTAETVLAQLGGRQFLGMTGAKDLTTVSDKLGGLALKLPQSAVRTFGPKGVNYVRITLDYSDTYDLEFGKISKRKGVQQYAIVSTFDNVYCDDLQDIFERETGLLTTLFAR